ncbi:CD83 antigen [Hippocampus comes]|uniref:CD83 antigen n=1 Tax=Hippocampus comes TaxID=109280 RepID=UPI00094EFB94|nr:PREDICTED: CD83 antigen [Hippocampus comes]
MCAILMTFLLLSLGGGWARSEEVHIVWGVLGDNCSLPCTAQVKPGVQYLSVSWYKMELRGNPPTPQRRGLVLRDLPDGAVERYVSLTREVILNNDTNDILLPNVTCRDNIAYKCRLYAPVGERNLEGEVVLKLSDCPGIPIGVLKMNIEWIILLSAVMILTLFFSLLSYCLLRKRRQDQKKGWKDVKASLGAI